MKNILFLWLGLFFLSGCMSVPVPTPNPVSKTVVILTAADCLNLEEIAENSFLMNIKRLPMPTEHYQVVKRLVKNYRTGSFYSPFFKIEVTKNVLYLYRQGQTYKIERRQGVCASY